METKIKYARKRRSIALSLREIGKEIGVSSSALSQYERNKCTLKKETVEKYRYYIDAKEGELIEY